MLSHTVEYAMRAMMHLASLQGTQVTNDRIALQASIPSGYLSKIMRDLVVAGLVSSFRGPGGGFILARAPGAITLLDVVNAVDPIRRIPKCPLGKPEHTRLCPLHRRLDEAMADVEGSFRRTTLAEVLVAGDEPVPACAPPSPSVARTRSK